MDGAGRGRPKTWWGALLAASTVVSLGCGEEAIEPPPEEPPGITVVTFNTGTTGGLGHDTPPDDGYGSAQAELSDLYYGDGLAWTAVVEDTEAFFAELQPDVVVFQEIFYSGDCPSVPAEAKPGFVCETWQPGDPTVAQRVLGAGYQVACNLGKPDKCAGIRKDFGTFAGCEADLCLDGLAGAPVPDCGSGSRVGRAVVERADGSTFTLVNVHGTSGLTQEDQDCRLAQFTQVFEDLGIGDGPAANGEVNLVMGDLNTDPSFTAEFDESGAKFLEHVGEGKPYHFISDIGDDAPKSYGLFNIDHVVSDTFEGDCQIPGLTPGTSPVSDVTYFDHEPVVCTLR
ncbi:MAG: hypothetical protein R3B72_35245 [Polyangiaceae bacterium]